MTVASATLRIVTGFSILATMGYAGFLHRSPWIVPLFGVVFTALYINGKSRQWRRIWNEHGARATLVNLAVTVPIQMVFAALCFFTGYGIGSVVHEAPMVPEIETFDYLLAGGLLAVGLAVGFVIQWLENSEPDLEIPDDEMAGILEAVFTLEDKTTCMPIEIFALSRRLADATDRSAAIDVMRTMFDSPNAFVRRAAMTALRFMGQEGRELEPAELDRRVVEGLSDPNPWVRYDAAWVAGEIVGEPGVFETALQETVRAHRVGPDADLEEDDTAEAQAVSRAMRSLAEIESRRSSLN